VEQFSGRQYRCRHCNEVFLDEKNLDRHLEHARKSHRGKTSLIGSKVPRLNESVVVQIMYVYDVKDALKPEWLKSKHNDVYDGIQFSHSDKKKGHSNED